MKKFRVAVMGYMDVVIEAESEADAGDKIYENPEVGELANMEVCEIVPEGEAFEMYTDLN